MNKTTNFEFNLPEGTDNVDIEVLNANMDKLDEIFADIYSKLPTPPQPGMTLRISDATSSAEIPDMGIAYIFDHSLGLKASENFYGANYQITITDGNNSFTDLFIAFSQEDGVVGGIYMRQAEMYSINVYDNASFSDGEFVPTENSCVLAVSNAASIDSISFVEFENSTFMAHSYTDAIIGMVEGNTVYNDNQYAYWHSNNISSDYFVDGYEYIATVYWNGTKESGTVSMTVVEETINGETYKFLHSADGRFDVVYNGSWDYQDGTLSPNEGSCYCRIKCVDNNTVIPVTINLYTADVS